MNNKIIFSLVTLLGVVVGAGIFALPYSLAQAGLIPFLFHLVLLGGATLTVSLLLGEVVLRTQGRHRLVGYARKYLGRAGGMVMIGLVYLGTTGTLLAYIIISGDFLRTAFGGFFPLSASQWGLLFWAFLTVLVYFGIRLIARVEVFTNLSFFLIILSILFFGLSNLEWQKVPLMSAGQFFLPYGLALFAFVGWSAILEIPDILKSREERKSFRKVVFLSQAIVFLLYLFFALAVVFISGSGTSKEALAGLVPHLGWKIMFFGALAGAITLADSFLILGLYLRNTLMYDYQLKRGLATLFSCGVPLILFLLGFKDFIGVVSVVGGILIAVQGVLILLIFKKAKMLGNREPEYRVEIPNIVLYLLMLVFIAGALTVVF
jgi:tyrosine-specific transport protein